MKPFIVLINIICFTTFSLVMSDSANAQVSEVPAVNNQPEKNPGDTLIVLQQAAPGTYEFLESKITETFSDEFMQQLLFTIEQRRHDTQIIYYKVTEYTIVKIYPRQ